jgi:hypothetical protein
MDKWISIIQTLIIGGTGVWATIWFSRSNKKREDDKILKELFAEFNHRYDKLNDHLSEIVESDEAIKLKDQLSKNQKAVIIDFFNLCAEEFFWHKRGRIDLIIWQSWHAGMNYWYNHTNPIVRDLWAEECRSENGMVSYYIENEEEFFKRR